MVTKNVFPNTVVFARLERPVNKQGKPKQICEEPWDRTKAWQASTNDIQYSRPLTSSPPSYPEKELLTAVCLLLLKTSGDKTRQEQSEVRGERWWVQRPEKIQIGNLLPSRGMGDSFKMSQSLKQKEVSSPKCDTWHLSHNSRSEDITVQRRRGQS